MPKKAEVQEEEVPAEEPQEEAPAEAPQEEVVPETPEPEEVTVKPTSKAASKAKAKPQAKRKNAPPATKKKEPLDLKQKHEKGKARDVCSNDGIFSASACVAAVQAKPAMMIADAVLDQSVLPGAAVLVTTEFVISEKLIFCTLVLAGYEPPTI